MHQSSFKNIYNFYKTDHANLPDLIHKYNHASLKFRDGGFTQQCELFVTKISTEKKDIRAKFPLYQILMSITKIFLLNEFEIANLALLLDIWGWKYDDLVYQDEANNLVEFPISSGVEINSECKRFIIYLLLVTFALKQYLNDKNDIDMIQAYIEKICPNF